MKKGTPFAVDSKTGFQVIESPVLILDFRGMVFYNTGMVERNVERFNLPEGTYMIAKGKIAELPRPVKYTLPVLPFPERNHSSPLNFKIMFGENPHKCTINWNTKEILFDNSMKKLSLPELFFILYHEYGHQKYGTEKFADLYAAKKMLQKGYNPSQIGSAPVTSLSTRQWERKKFLIDNLINV